MEKEQIKIVNYTDSTVLVKDTKEGSLQITIYDKKAVPLGKAKIGSTVKIGKREFIVLDHSYDCTAVIAKNIVTNLYFGEGANYFNSQVRAYLNSEFYRSLAKDIGEKNIELHVVRLTAENGAGKEYYCQDKISLLTTELYRKYFEILDDKKNALQTTWWTATPVCGGLASNNVCVINQVGIIRYNPPKGTSLGIRPYCIIDNNVIVSSDE